MITNPNDLIKSIDELPSQLRTQKLIAIDKEKEVSVSKLKYDVAFGMALMEANKPNATEKKAFATTKTQEEAENLIEKQYNLKKEESGLKFLEDEFTAKRKIGSLEIELMRANVSGN